MKFRFIGDPRDNGSGPDVIEKFDHVFNRVDWTDVQDEWVIAKLLGSSHFESDGVMSEPKKPRGWPKGKPRKPVIEAEHGQDSE